jgi:phosphate uptake regulator
MKKASNIWQGMSETLARARKGRAVVPKVEAEEKVRPVEEAIEEVEVDLEEKVLEFINQHPEGLKVSDMEAPLGVVMTKLGKIAKKLLEEGKVRKEESLYFPLWR